MKKRIYILFRREKKIQAIVAEKALQAQVLAVPFRHVKKIVYRTCIV